MTGACPADPPVCGIEPVVGWTAGVTAAVGAAPEALFGVSVGATPGLTEVIVGWTAGLLDVRLPVLKEHAQEIIAITIIVTAINHGEFL